MLISGPIVVKNNAILQVQDFSIGVSAGVCLYTTFQGMIILGAGITFTASARHMWAECNSVIQITANYTVGGGASIFHYGTDIAGLITCQGGVTVTVSIGLTFLYFAASSEGGVIQLYSMVYSGAVGITAQRYFVRNNGIVDTNGGGADYFPGSTAGTVSTGGIYL